MVSSIHRSLTIQRLFKWLKEYNFFPLTWWGSSEGEKFQHNRWCLSNLAVCFNSTAFENPIQHLFFTVRILCSFLFFSRCACGIWPGLCAFSSCAYSSLPSHFVSVFALLTSHVTCDWRLCFVWAALMSLTGPCALLGWPLCRSPLSPRLLPPRH